MKKRLKLALTLLVLLLAVAFLGHFFDWMNLPSDRSFWSGAVGSLLMLVAVPALFGGLNDSDKLLCHFNVLPAQGFPIST